MPIYEYRCRSCELEFQRLIMKNAEEKNLLCPKCGTKNIHRLISTVAFHISEQQRLATFDPNATKTDSFYSDSRNIGLTAKKRAQRLGVDLGKGFEEKLEKLRTDPGSALRDSE